MERKADLPVSNLGRPATGEANLNLNLTSSSSTTSSSSSLSVSPPDFLSQLHAVFKRPRPLGTMKNFSRASRVLVSQGESSKSSVSSASVAASSDRKLPQTITSRGAGRLLNVGSDQRKDGAVEIRMNPQEDSLLTPPSITETVTNDQGKNMCPFGLQQREAELHADQKKASVAASSSHVKSSNDDFKKDQFSLGDNASLTFQSTDARMTTETRMDGISSYLHSLALTEGGDQFGNGILVNNHELKRHDLPNMEICGASGAQAMEKRDELRHNQHSVDPMIRSTVVGSSCATTMSIHSGPTCQCTHAPLAGQTGFSTQTSSAVENCLGVSACILPEAREPMTKEGDKSQDCQQPLHMGEGNREKVVSSNADHLHSQVPPAKNSSSNVDVEPSQSRKVEKGPRKKKYDPDVFFKVNGKLYQKLGKIGSGGSSEVHKVITSDCTIYALKQIKLKGRDYPTAYGFCQEIEYLNKLKGKSNIIQLIDYEVTDKTLFQEVMNGSMTIKDGKIKDDQYIYMVLEYGEIDLAHMLSQKWKEVESSSWKIDGNWLRFYWQQMLEAVNTIHEERIVHSDLKPANFMLVRGSLKLIDFGIAKAILSDTTNIQRDAQVGTLNYMSPEAFMWNEQDSSGNTIKCGRPSDIWSLGCILYQMVYGKTPFAEYKTFWAKFKVITDKNHEITYEPVSNPLLIDLMRRCLAWDRNERWRIPQLLQHPFLVPPIPRDPSPVLQDNQQYKFLMERLGEYWDDPEVSRLCSELHEVVRNRERAHSS